PESGIVFDYTYETMIEAMIRMTEKIDPETLPERVKQAVLRFRQVTANEPWIFGLPDKGEKEYLTSLGFELKHVMGLNSAEAVEKYLTRSDGSIFGMMPAAAQQGYFILEAAVAAGESQDEGKTRTPSLPPS